MAPIDVYCLEFISHNIKEILYIIQTPKETNHEIKDKRYKFSLVSDTDVKKSCFLCGVNSLSAIFKFSQFHKNFQK